MPTVLLMFLAAGAIVTAAAWRLSRRRSSAGHAEPRAGPLDQWLMERYQLTRAERDEVRDAVLRGRAATDPALRAAAHVLAGDLLAGRLRYRQPGTLMAAILSVLAAAMTAVFYLPRGGTTTIIGLVFVVVWLLSALTFARIALRSPRRTIRRALEANRGAEAAR